MNLSTPEKKRKRQDQVNAANARRIRSERDIEIPDVAQPDRRRQLEEDDAAWLSTYLPEVFFNPFTDDHLEMISDVGDALTYGVKKAKAASRGDGKSSILKYLMLKYSLQRKLWFPLVIAATAGKAKKTTGSLRRRLASRQPTSSEIAAIGDRGGSTAGLVPNLLAEDYPLECYVARHVDPWPSRARNVTANGQRRIHVEWGSADGFFVLPTWEDEEPIGPIMMSIGWSSDELQGCNIYDRRPDCVMLDDLDSRDSLAADDGLVAGKIETAIESTIAGLGGPDGMLGQYFLGTCASTEAAIYLFSDPKQKPAWDGKRVPAIRQWPERMDLWEKYKHKRTKGMQEGDPYAREAHQFYIDNREAMEAGSIVSNPYRFKDNELPDGSKSQVSNLQFCIDYICDNTREAFDTEYQQDPPQTAALMESKVTGYHVANCAGTFAKLEVDPTAKMVVRGIDVRKIELHQVTLSSEHAIPHRICDYNVKSHGTSETTVEQAEYKILDALHAMSDSWDADPLTDCNGMHHATDLTLIDKGWVGSWTEDGTVKTWASQPVETFCMEMGLRHWLPCKGHPNYRSQKPARGLIVGDNWHINRGKGAERRCDEVIWNAAHWHLLAEELFMLPDDDADKIELFESGEEIWINHKAFGDHIAVGAKQLHAQLAKGTRSKRPTFVRDHWWDGLAQCLVAKSVETFIRDRAIKRTASRRTLAQMQSRSQ